MNSKYAKCLYSQALKHDQACTIVDLQIKHFRWPTVLSLAYKLAAEPDWDFMREHQSKLAFLFGIDDHWGPLQLFEEVN